VGAASQEQEDCELTRVRGVKRFLVNLTFFFCFFAWFKVLPIEAECQPIAGVVAALIILLWGVKRNHITVTLLWFMFLLAGYYLVSIVVRPELLSKATLDLIAYCIPLFVVLALSDKLDYLSVRLYFVVLALWLVMGIVQYFDLLGAAGKAFEPFANLIINRWHSSRWDAIRGVGFFASEPSMASRSVLLFLATGLFFRATGRIDKRQFRLVLLATAAMSLLNRSGTGAVLCGLFVIGFLAGYLFSLASRGKLTSIVRVTAYALLLSSAMVLVFSQLTKSGYRSRSIDSIQVANAAIVKQGRLDMHALTRIGGFRFPTLYVGYLSLGDQNGLGHGISSWRTEFDRVAKLCGVNLMQLPLMASEKALKVVKPSAYAATVAFDAGIPGLFLLLFFLALFLVPSRGVIKTPFLFGVRTALFLSASLHILAFGLISIPTPWLMLAYAKQMDRTVECSQITG
jgi:PIN domain nuclease of toxin-antitoxin system